MLWIITSRKLKKSVAITSEFYCYFHFLMLKTREENKNSKMRIVFTAMHGVGKVWVEKAFQAFGLPHYIPGLFILSSLIRFCSS